MKHARARGSTQLQAKGNLARCSSSSLSRLKTPASTESIWIDSCDSSSSIRESLKCGTQAGKTQKRLRRSCKKNVAFCNIDQPVLGRSLKSDAIRTSGIGYVRLHGRNYDQWFESDNRDDRYNYLYKESEL